MDTRSPLRLVCWFTLLAPLAAAAEDLDLPPEVRAFVEAGATPLALERADLDGDGRQDVLLAYQRPAADAAEDLPSTQRPLLILLRQPDGGLRLAARNERVILCEECGGMLGDPFQGISTGKKSFTVHLHGGSRYRWGFDYRFAWSRRDQTWQLVSVVETEIDTLAEEDEAREGISREYRPPRDFGKIGFAAFDPDQWKDRGPR
jgi:hypothetical protein